MEVRKIVILLLLFPVYATAQTLGSNSNGINGFPMGMGVLLGKLQVRYARAYYQSNTAYNQLGLNLKLNEYFSLGKFGENIGW